MRTATVTPTRFTRIVHVPAFGASLVGELAVPDRPRGVVVFVEGAHFASAHAAERALARAIEHAGFATLRLDLLTPDEELAQTTPQGLDTDIALISRRLIETIDWTAAQACLAGLPIGLFVAGRGTAAAVVASVVERGHVAAIVSRGGRLEQAHSVLSRVTTPTLLIASGGNAAEAHENEAALRRMPGCHEMILVTGPMPRSDDPAAAEELGRHTLGWFERHLATTPFAAGESDDAW